MTVREFAAWVVRAADDMQLIARVDGKPKSTTAFSRSNVRPNAKQNLLLSTNDKQEAVCSHCADAHKLERCPAFQRLPVEKRWHLASQLRLCFSCFDEDHQANSCERK